MLKKIKLFFICVFVLCICINVYTLLGVEKNPKSSLQSSDDDQAKRFSEFREMLLNSVPPEKKDEIEKELQNLSRNNDFLKQLTPQKMEQVRNEIKTYNSASTSDDIKKDIDNDGDPEVLQVNNETELNKESKNTEEKNISFDFPNVSLEEFSRFVANLNEKILIGANLLQGNVTLKTPEKISLKELMQVFEALLNSNGLSFMMAGDYLQIYQKSDSDVRVYKINYLKSADVAKSLSDIFKMSFRVGGVPERVMINSLDQANSVVVLAPKEKHAEIEEAIKEIDFRRRQVLMEVRVIELTYTNQFGFGGTVGWNYHNVTTGAGPNITSYDGEVPIPPSFANISSPYSGVVYNNGQFMYDLQADERISHLKILSQPRILTSENQKAEIKVGQQQPVVNAQTNMGVSSNSAPVEQTTVDWKDIGIDLNITPRVNSRRDVSLDLDMKITSIMSYTTVGSWKNYPVIAQRIAKNSSTVKDNEMLLIGGLLKDEKVTTRKQVPFFGDMPFVGWMFATTEEKVEQNELIILIIPRVIESPEDGLIVTEREKDTFKNYDKDSKEEVDSMLKGKKDKSWDIFNLYEYFNDDQFRKEQALVPQEWSDKR